MSNGKPAHGMFCWNELLTWDVESATAFYTKLLGWNAADSGIPGMKYTVLRVDDKDAGGLMAMPPEVPAEVPSHWLSYIAVDDVDAMAKKTEELGGKVITPPRDIPNIGRHCLIQDPTGAVVALITFTTH